MTDTDLADLDEEMAFTLMCREPTMIKRPVLEVGDKVMNGFKPGVYEELFGRG